MQYRQVLQMSHLVWQFQQTDMAKFTYSLPNGKSFNVDGDGLSAAQAKAIFDQQSSAGSLIGLKPGASLSAATQAVSGLPSAQGAVNQALSGVTGALGAGVPGAAGILGSVSKNLSTAGGALGGSLAPGISGLTGAVGPAVTNLSGEITNKLGAASLAGSVGSLATTAIGTINRTIGSTAVTSPINTADFVKQIPALGPIGSMSASDVSGVLAQSKNLVNQGAGVLSNTTGAGSFGLNVPQLETAGILKPGTAALAAVSGASLSSVLKSPAVFTGANGIKSIDSLLSNPSLQSGVQQDLMAKGTAALGAVGIPVGSLSAQGLAGVALSAAKSVPNTEALLKGLPSSADAKAQFNTLVKDGSFAVNLAQSKVEPVFKAETTPVPASDTVDRDTLTGATNRVLGNDKIPAPDFATAMPDVGTISQTIQSGFTDYGSAVQSIIPTWNTINEKLKTLENQQVISQQEWMSIAGQQQAANQSYLDSLSKYYVPASAVYDSAPAEIQKEFKPLKDKIFESTGELTDLAFPIIKRIKQLASKISTNVSA
jgi:hypothetical protein